MNFKVPKLPNELAQRFLRFTRTVEQRSACRFSFELQLLHNATMPFQFGRRPYHILR